MLWMLSGAAWSAVKPEKNAAGCRLCLAPGALAKSDERGCARGPPELLETLPYEPGRSAAALRLCKEAGRSWVLSPCTV